MTVLDLSRSGKSLMPLLSLGGIVFVTELSSKVLLLSLWTSRCLILTSAQESITLQMPSRILTSVMTKLHIVYLFWAVVLILVDINVNASKDMSIHLRTQLTTLTVRDSTQSF